MYINLNQEDHYCDLEKYNHSTFEDLQENK